MYQQLGYSQNIDMINTNNDGDNQLTPKRKGSYLPQIQKKDKLVQIRSRIKKGKIADPCEKTIISSIPSKREMIVYKYQPVQGFTSSSKRFEYKEEQNPGPAEYQSHRTSVSKQNSTGQVQKGFGGAMRCFSENQLQLANQGPGPGQYNLETESMTLKQRTYSNKGLSSFQQPEISINQSKKSFQRPYISPGPGEYSVAIDNSQINYKSDNNLSAKVLIKNINPCNSSFLTKGGRYQYINFRKGIPGPGIYEVSQDLSESKLSNLYAQSSNFAQPSEKFRKQDIIKAAQRYLSNEKSSGSITDAVPFGSDSKDPLVPGPGAYSQQLPTLQPKSLLKKTMSSFKIGLKDRFGDFIDKSLNNSQQIPDPTTYDIQKYGFDKVTKVKAMVSQPAFMSECLRQPYSNFESRLGPSYLNPPIPLKKKGFLLNLSKKWI